MSKQSHYIHDYHDIIDMPHPISPKHPRMSRLARAAQFAPFAALTGHKEAILEKERLTEKKRILDDSQKLMINSHLLELDKYKKQHLLVKVTYFQADAKKSGGAYLTVTDRFQKLDEYLHLLILSNGMKIPFDDIYEIEIQEES